MKSSAEDRMVGAVPLYATADTVKLLFAFSPVIGQAAAWALRHVLCGHSAQFTDPLAGLRQAARTNLSNGPPTEGALMRTVDDVGVMDASFTTTDQLQGAHMTTGMAEWRGRICSRAALHCPTKSSGCKPAAGQSKPRQGLPDFFQRGDLACG